MGEDAGNGAGFGDLLLGTLDRALSYDLAKSQIELHNKPIREDIGPWYYGSRTDGVVPANRPAPAVAGLPAWTLPAGIGLALLVGVFLLARR